MAAAAAALDNYLVQGMADERERIEFKVVVILKFPSAISLSK
mgnify:CR=1 FL=1